MVALQILCKCIASGDIDLIDNNQLTEEYFPGYEAEYNYVVNHYKQYGNVPDKVTFLAKFPDDDFVNVTETDRYLIDTIREEHLFEVSVPVVQKIAKLLETDANVAVEYMLEATKQLQPNYNLSGIDIVSQAKTRYNEYIDRKKKQDDWFFTTGFPELDDVIHGIQRTEEFLLIYARTNQGKSWVLEKIISHIWQLGFSVGYISAEMTPSSIGYRFDTLYQHFSNKGLTWGKDEINDKQYEEYIEELTKSEHSFIVSTPADFDRRITVTKLKNWVKKYNLQAIAIDGVNYLSDERGKRGDNKTTALTNISEDLMNLSIELRIPVLAVVQANRSGVIQCDSDDMPELDTIRDSDGLSFNASKVLALRQNKDGDLLLQVKKQRNGLVGKKIAYHWNPNEGEFINMPMEDDFKIRQDRSKHDVKLKKQEAKEDAF